MVSILVIDDDAVDREAVRRYLARPDKTVTVAAAETGQEGLGLLRERQFDCVFLDYQLPDMDGISLLRAIYDENTDLAAAPVVMLTGQGSEAVMADALRWGAQDYIVKDNLSEDTIGIAMAKARELFELKKSRHHAEEQLRHAQKMEALGQLTGGVAHDFNNLLTVILGNTRILQRRLNAPDRNADAEELRKKVLNIELAAKRGAELVRRLMVFTRQRAPAAEVLDLNACLEETVELVSRALGELVETRLIPGNDLWPVRIDIGQLENALINLAVNARDAMPGGGTLTIETQNLSLDEEYTFRHPDIMPGPYVMISVSDTGCGMPASVARRIFEPFFTTKPPGQGTGLGLSMVYGFVRQSGGYILAYSEEGHGTVFRLYLPRYIPDGETITNDNAQDIPTGTETILVVENDEDLRRMAVRMLDQLGYRTVPAADGRTALEILKREHRNIDLIFTDLVMPGGMGGAELVRRAQEYYPGILALYTSGYTENAVPDLPLKDRNSLISKPYRKEALARRIRAVLGPPLQENPHAAKTARPGD